MITNTNTFTSHKSADQRHKHIPQICWSQTHSHHTNLVMKNTNTNTSHKSTDQITVSFCVYVCLCVCVCVCVRVCYYIFGYECEHIPVCVCVCMCVIICLAVTPCAFQFLFRHVSDWEQIAFSFFYNQPLCLHQVSRCVCLSQSCHLMYNRWQMAVHFFGKRGRCSSEWIVGRGGMRWKRELLVGERGPCANILTWTS